MIEDLAFFALSPREYIRRPQATEQYGHVLRVSVVRTSLNSRTSARTGAGENPIMAMEEPPNPMPHAFRNCRRDMCMLLYLPT
jgi:hypothetical protein